MNTAQKAMNTLAGNGGFQQTDVADLQGRTVLVTGATVGIGFEVARAFAESRARVLLLSRKTEHGDDAIAEIKRSVSEAADVHFIECDLGNLAKVREVGDRIREGEERLDIVVADAGVGVNKFDVSSDNIDRHFAVNHLGHFLLINRVLPLIRKTSKLPSTPPPRIVAISSELHRQAPSSVQFASEEEVTEVGSNDLSAVSLYARSKLANILFTKYTLVERAIRPSGDRIFALATHPGAVHTGQQDQFKEAYGKVFGTLAKAVVVPFMRNPEQGSLSTLWAATSEDVEKNSWQGCYFTDPGQLGKETAQADDEQLGKNLHELSEQLVREKIGKDGLLAWY
ncbi:NAD(P)-binding protein [Leucogyrophana mollusca]|uniref:NAD(P)-binding protein n=1 Tax=Leucogyrophana mollusca TaxID=85980 RepID=A0ACB8BLR8_9AGAM|nr:NAD(P)-binding protein [Leucogyrophana mollusca]